MPQELTTQRQFDTFADEVARELGTHCRTAPDTPNTHMLSQLIIDGEGRALSLRQHDCGKPTSLRIYAALPDDSEVRTPRSVSRQEVPGTSPGRSPGACTRCTPRPPGSPPSSPRGRKPRPATAAPWPRP